MQQKYNSGSRTAKIVSVIAQCFVEAVAAACFLAHKRLETLCVPLIMMHTPKL
jgi:hypothetical protein